MPHLPTVEHMVELIHWPEGAMRRSELRSSDRPCLLLVAESAPPPSNLGTSEDWIRLPTSSEDIDARVETLVSRLSGRPAIDENGIIRTAEGWVVLPSVEARLATAMLERFGRVTDHAALFAAGWPDQRPRRNLLDVHLHRLRRRLSPIGLQIRTVRKRGYILQRGETDSTATHPAIENLVSD